MVVLAVAGLLAGGAAPAGAQEDEGVVLDPDSPASKEYVVPLESVRRGADPARSDSDTVVQGSRTAPPFGEGIERESVAPSDAAAGSDGSPGSEGAEAGTTERRQDGSERRDRKRSSKGGQLPPEVLAAADRPPAPSSDVSSLLVIGIGGLLVVAIGGAAGVLYRRRSPG